MPSIRWTGNSCPASVLSVVFNILKKRRCLCLCLWLIAFEIRLKCKARGRMKRRAHAVLFTVLHAESRQMSVKELAQWSLPFCLFVFLYEMTNMSSLSVGWSAGLRGTAGGKLFYLSVYWFDCLSVCLVVCRSVCRVKRWCSHLSKWQVSWLLKCRRETRSYHRCLSELKPSFPSIRDRLHQILSTVAVSPQAAATLNQPFSCPSFFHLYIHESSSGNREEEKQL